MHIWDIAEMYWRQLQDKEFPDEVKDMWAKDFFTYDRLIGAGATPAIAKRICYGVAFCDLYVGDLIQRRLALANITGVGEKSLGYMIAALNETMRDKPQPPVPTPSYCLDVFVGHDEAVREDLVEFLRRSAGSFSISTVQRGGMGRLLALRIITTEAQALEAHLTAHFRAPCEFEMHGNSAEAKLSMRFTADQSHALGGYPISLARVMTTTA